MLGIVAVGDGRSQGVPKVFRAPMYRAHCAVIFAITRLSCLILQLQRPLPFTSEQPDKITISLVGLIMMIF